MNNIKTFISFFLCITSFTIDSFSQTLSYLPDDQSKNSSIITETDTPTHLVATVFQASNDPFSIKVHFENYGPGKVSVKLESSTALLHKEVVEHKTYARKYNMYNLPVGDYQIEVKNEKEVYTKRVSIKNENGMRVLSIM